MSAKPEYRNKHACTGCGCGYLDCVAYALNAQKCCPECAHPTRWTTDPPYTPDEMAHMTAAESPNA